MRQIPLALGLDPNFCFESFIAGTNQQVVATLSEQPLTGGIIYLWGPTGVGKTHLLQATATRLIEQGGQVVWASPRHSLPWEFAEKTERSSEEGQLIIMDDCQAFSIHQQQAAFALLATVALNKVVVVAAGNVPPVDLPLREDLRSRLGWGLIFKLEPLGEGAIKEVLRREALRRGFELSADVLHYLQTRFERDVGSLMHWLNRLDRFALAEKRSITVPLLKKLLQEGEL